MLLSLVFRQCWRQKSNIEFRILGISLWLSIFAITTLCCLALSLRSVLYKDATNLLGADLIIESTYVLPEVYYQYAKKQNLKATSMTEFFSMIMVNNKMQLVNIAAIDNTFPLRGQLQIASNRKDTFIHYGPPPPGEAWVEASILRELNIALDQKVQIGDTQFTLSGIIQSRPVAISNSSLLASVVYVNAADLQAMQVLQPGSRITYRLLLSGTAQQLGQYKQNFSVQNENIQWITPQKGRQTVSRTYAQVEKYISLIVLIQSLLAGLAIALAAHEYSVGQQQTVAILRCLGATSVTIMRLYVFVLLLFAAVILITSISMGYILSMIILHYAKNAGFYGAALGMQGAILGGLAGMILLTGFSLPSLFALRSKTVQNILQQRFFLFSPVVVMIYSMAILCLIALSMFFVEDITVILKLSVQILIIALLLFAVANGLWKIFRLLSTRGSLAWRFGISYLIRHPWQTMTQFVVFTMVTTLILLVQIIQNDFIRVWKTQLPETTPNYFLLNIESDEVKTMAPWLKTHGIEDIQFYPVVRGRLIGINGNNVTKEKDLGRPLNLTWMKVLPSDNQITQGPAWETVSEGQTVVTVEKEFAQREQIQVGDKLIFQIAEKQIEAKVSSIRTLEWESFKPNFFVIFPPGVLENFPYAYITSMYLSSSQQPLLTELLEKYSDISIIDIDMLLKKFKKMMDTLSIALSGIFIFVFLLGILMMYTNLLSTLKERLHESAMLRLLGAKQALIGKILLVEFFVLGILSSSIASIIALLLAQYMARNVFIVPFTMQLKWLLIGSILGTSIIILFGLMGTRGVFRVPPLWLLRRNQ